MFGVTQSFLITLPCCFVHVVRRRQRKTRMKKRSRKKTKEAATRKEQKMS